MQIKQLLNHFLYYCFFIIISSTALAQTSSLYNTNRPRTMAQRWELDSASRSGTFVITPYKLVYIIPARWSSNPNEKPVSGNSNPIYDYEEQVDYNNLEAKFQLSFKVKLFESMFWGHGDLWVAYTQLNNWQVYNKSLSRPFREINYEPEVIVNFATNYTVLGFKGKMVGVSFNHRSNGQKTPLSRSWNRIVLQAGFEKDNWQLYVRPWLRIRGEKKEDDNPDIEEYMGRGELIVIYSKGKDSFVFTGRHNLNFNKHTRGHAEISWAHIIKGNLSAYIQADYGYGETMVDYNNLQGTVGAGISLVGWL